MKSRATTFMYMAIKIVNINPFFRQLSSSLGNISRMLRELRLSPLLTLVNKKKELRARLAKDAAARCWWLLHASCMHSSAQKKKRRKRIPPLSQICDWARWEVFFFLFVCYLRIKTKQNCFMFDARAFIFLE